MSDILKLAQAIQNLADVLGANGAAIGAVAERVSEPPPEAQTAQAKTEPKTRAKAEPKAKAVEKKPDTANLRAETSAAVTNLFKTKKDRDLMTRLLGLYEQEDGSPATAASNVKDEDLADLKAKAEALLEAEGDEIEAILGGEDEDPGFG